MKAVVTNVQCASVRVDGTTVGKIGNGFLILLGVTHGDTEAEVNKLADKICGLRVFKNEAGKINKSLADIGGEVLVVSQFTLYASCRHGRRPDFLAAAKPDIANELYERFVARVRENGFHTETGVFGAYMEVESINDGPFTLVIDTEDLK